MQRRFDAVLSVILTVAAVVIVGLLVRREFFAAGTRSVTGIAAEPAVREPQWVRLRKVSIPVGDSVAPVEIVEFTDFECPACRGLHQRLAEIRNELKGVASLRLIHFPLDIHRFARPACPRGELRCPTGTSGGHARPAVREAGLTGSQGMVGLCC